MTIPRSRFLGLVVAGKYRVTDLLGGGGMGEVFRAEHLPSGRPVALKILRRDLAQDANATRRFFQEAEAANKIRHPNIVQIIDAGFSESGPFLAMELLVGECTGRTLSRLGKLPVEAVTAIGLHVLGALEVAHRSSIIHRDLKPENVYLHYPSDADSITVKLLDFGIAKVLEPLGPTPRTHTGVVFGTPDYLSPEQANGEHWLDGRSDFFALGVLMFELLTGTRPFRAATAVATAYKIVHTSAPRLVEAGGPEHPMLEAVLARALRKRPEERYPTAGDFIRELELVVPDAEVRKRALSALLKPSTVSSTELGPWPVSSGDQASVTSGFALTEPSGTPSSQAPRHRRAAAPRSTPPPSISSSSFHASLWPPPSTPPSSTMSSSSFHATLWPPPSTLPSSRDTGETKLDVESAPPSEPPPSDPSGPRLRGSILRAIDRSVVRRHGILLRAGIVDRLPAKYANEFRYSTITGAAFYGVHIFEQYANALGELFNHADSSHFRELGRLSAERELTILLRPLFRAADDFTLLRKGAVLWAKLLDFGTWSVHRENDRIVMHIAEIASAPTPLRHWLVGMIEQTLWSAGFDGALLSIRDGDYAPGPNLVVEVTSGRRR